MMTKKFRKLNKIIAGILMPVFLSLLLPANSQADQIVETERQVLAININATDPFYTTNASDIDKQWYLSKIKISQAWEHSTGSSNVVVAIIDTGIHASHIELNDGRVIAGYNSITKTPIPANSNSDDNGHGTAVAGVIGAIPNNAKGIVGINWKVSLMPIKALSADGTGGLSAVTDGIIWATDHGANIINLSLGGIGFDADLGLSSAITYAYERGVLIVAAAGNDLADEGINLDKSPVYPICGDNGKNMVLGVAATNVNDLKANFSNFGHNCVDITAPGERILTTAFLPTDPANNVLIYGSGTSLATPVVSGVAALLKASNPNLSNVEIRTTLMKTADNIDALNTTRCLHGSCNGFLGSGRINALTSMAPQPIGNNTLVRETGTGHIYLVVNNIKRFVSSFVFSSWKFDLSTVVSEANNQLKNFATGAPLLPVDGTLVKSANNAQVYIINQELKRPLTLFVFNSRGLRFADIKILPESELSTYSTGNWYWPPDRTLVLVDGSPLVYVMDNEVRRPTTYFVFTQRRLSFSKVVRITLDEFSHIPVPNDQYWLPPLDGTLIKSDSHPAIYLIENGTRKLLSYETFIARNYKFSNVKSLPQSEVEIIASSNITL
jgi:hypothetical protein